jgi:hypothetical protein
MLLKFKPLGALALGMVLSIFCTPAGAGNLYVTTCYACKTTADFIAQARYQAGLNVSSGLYTGVSVTNAESAYVQVSGNVVIKLQGGLHVPTLQITSAIPVDANGNSLAGLSESDQEAVYAALDQQVFVLPRATIQQMPVTIILNPTPGVPGSYTNLPYTNFKQTWSTWPDFYADTSLGNLSTVFGLWAQRNNIPMGLYVDVVVVTIVWKEPNGDVVTIKMHNASKSSTTIKMVFDKGSVQHKNGTTDVLDKNGNIVPPKSPTPGGGGGSFTDPGTGQYLVPQPYCFAGSYADVGGDIIGSGGWAPC